MIRKMILLAIAVLVSLPARADVEYVAIWPLQLSCGIQPRNNGFLSYGTIVFTRYDSVSDPEIANFQAVMDTYAEHPFCAVLSTAMSRQEPLNVFLEPSGGNWILEGVDNPAIVRRRLF